MRPETIGAQVQVDRQLATLDAQDGQALARLMEPWDTTARLALRRQRQDPELAALAARALAEAMAARAGTLAQLRGQAHSSRPGLPT